MNINYKIILASQSPRRQELLKKLGYDFEIVKLNIDESYPENLKKQGITEYLAHQKSVHFGKVQKNTIVITADTIVWMDGKPLEKPNNNKEAIKMLKKLSGNSHKVYTSVGFSTNKKFKCFTDCSKVYFNEIDDYEIDFYVNNYEVLDKAGAYGIQDWIGLTKIKKIKGSYFTIMGFPTHIIYNYLKNLT